MKIGLCGTQSVGKTTLVKELIKLPEFKDYHLATERSKYLMNLGIPLNTDSTLKGQTIFLAERCSELMHENLITDRTVVDVMAFTKAAKSINDIDQEAYTDYASRFISEYDYLFYIDPKGTEIEDNGVRETDKKYRDLIDFIIRHTLRFYSHKIKNLTTIYGTTENRLLQIKEAIYS